jgi:hypothetical protein
MALNQFLRRSLVVVAATLAITGLLTGRSLSQDDDEDENTPPEKPKVAAAQDAKTLTITITADENGKMSSITVGVAKLFDGPLEGNRLRLFDKRLKDVFAIEGTCDRVLFRVDRALNAGDLIKVIHVCDKQKMADGNPIKKMSFVVLDD